MRIESASAKGPHKREVAALTKLEAAFPSDWYGYSSLWMRRTAKSSEMREIDVIIITHDRIIIADLKDWYGRIENRGGFWYQEGKYRGGSDCDKIAENARCMVSHLTNYMNKIPPKLWDGPRPTIQPFVVFTNKNVDISGLSDADKAHAILLDDFLKLAGRSAYNQFFQHDSDYFSRKFKKTPLCDKSRKNVLSKFFKVDGSSPFLPAQMLYGEVYKADGDPIFFPQGQVYQDYRATSNEDRNNTAMLRLWDYSKLETSGGAEETRRPLVQRESRALAFIQDRDAEFYGHTAVKSMMRDTEYSIRYWELFDLSRNARTLLQHARARGENISFEKRIEHAKFLISAIADLHQIKVAHRDIGPHCVWIEGNTLKLSHFGVAQFPDPDTQTLSNRRIDMMGTNAKLPEDFFGEKSTAFAKDVFLTASLVWELLTGVPLRKEENVPVLDDSSAFPPEISEDLTLWFRKALNPVPEDRFQDGLEMLADFVRKTQSFKNEPFSYAEEFVAHKQNIFPMASYPPNSGPWISMTPPFIWRHQQAEDAPALIVKYWPANGLSDASVSEFLYRAQKLAALDLSCVQKIINFGIASDNTLFLVTEEVSECTVFDERALSELNRSELLSFCQKLLAAVDALHANDLFHGDIKPENILLSGQLDSRYPVLIDIPDYSSSGAQDLGTARYTPTTGDGSPLSRDRFAICQCVEDILVWVETGTSDALSSADIQSLREAIATITEGSPANHTLHPVKQAIERLLHPKRQPVSATHIPEYHIESPFLHEQGELFADNQQYAIFIEEDTKRNRVRFQIAGAAQTAVIEISIKDWSLEYISCNDAETKTLRFVWGKAQHKLTAGISFGKGRSHSIGALKGELKNAYEQFKENSASKDAAPVTHAPETSDEADDLQAIVAAPDAPRWSIIELWRATIEAEEELTQEITVTLPPRKDGDAFIVSYETPDGQPALDFEPDDRLELLSGTTTVGIVDSRSISSSRQSTTMKVWKPRRQFGDIRIAPQRTYKIVSTKAMQNLRRRRDALNAIIDDNCLIHNLVDYFAPATSKLPVVMGVDVTNADIERYRLNKQQVSAFKNLWKYGPIGLLQGPPGTGKTHFIASFCHYALTKGGARNVLILSQANEATNHAVEKIMDLGAMYGGDIEIIRVGNMDKVSDRLVDLHSNHLQDSYRQQFKAEMLERVLLLSRRLGLEPEFVRQYYALSIRFTDLIEQIIDGAPEDISEAFSERRKRNLMQAYAVEAPAWLDGKTVEPEMFLYTAKDTLLDKYGINNLDAVRQLDFLIRISRRWMNVLASKNGSLENFFVRSRSVVSGTCVGIGHQKIGLSQMQFDLVIIDEAARCTAGELAVGLKVAKRALLVGDHKQLAPMYNFKVVNDVNSRVAGIERADVLRSDFERIFESGYGKAIGQTLTEQYRMADDIAKMVSDEFYPGTKLVSGRGPVPPHYDGLPVPFHEQLVWVDTSDMAGSQAYEQKSGTSYNNRYEADVIVHLLETLASQQALIDGFGEFIRAGEPTIGVICTYAAQAALVRQRMMLKEWPEGFEQMVKVDTVDSYQGKDNEIIILSLTRRNKKGIVGHVANLNRINVALSRAKNRLVVVGCRDIFSKEWAENPLSGIARKVVSPTYKEAHMIPSKKLGAR
ncbi:AAA domain-containing protein [Thalassospira xiamenensis]|uniref:Protein kinase domain-containing protein n=1 Tax=Thalassospira xiamenensis TaxID=220697 RepID=A0A285TTR9_9PROT|nr:AAA domain-containing protein [Thalassospira xiamenensis]SOC27508.1 Protein kinase domain-containing protein [Thalassospira xiamenensis]